MPFKMNQNGQAVQERGKDFFVCFFLSCIAVFALHCKLEVSAVGGGSLSLADGLHRFYGAFYSMDFVDLFALWAINKMLRFTVRKDREIDVGFMLASLAFAVTFIVSASFRKYNSAVFLFADTFQKWLSLFCISGYGITFYGVLRGIYHLFGREGNTEPEKELHKINFPEKHFWRFGFCIIVLGWLPWIFMNYPGSGCPDSMLQLQEFLGDAEWGAGHPPLSTLLMGCLFVLGRFIRDANFGFFLYCFFQTIIGALLFSLSMKKLLELGIPVKWCLAGIAYFAFTPLWGVYAQWVEKDLLFAEVSVWQMVCMMEILIKKEYDRKDMLSLVCSSLLVVFLRNNGIYTILPALLFLALRFRGKLGKHIGVWTIVILMVYAGVTKGVYPALHIHKIPIMESLSIPFQQTARYVCIHGEEVTKREREVIDALFDYETMSEYNPVISDPIKIHFKGGDLTAYFEIWRGMFLKHPETYAAAFINKGYGYMAPVSQNIEAWVQQKYYDYMREIGLYHVFPRQTSDILVQIWNLSMTMPLIKYLCTPGFYTWIVAGLTVILIKRRKFDALLLFVPCFMNILVCLASPLASAIRYELPTVAAVPLMIGWGYLSVKESSGRRQS